MKTKKNTPPIAKNVYYDEVQFPINSRPTRISFGRIPSELATDKETNLRSHHFRINAVFVDGNKQSNKASGITIDHNSARLAVNLNLNKPAYQPYRFAMRPVEVFVDFKVKDDKGLTDNGSFAFQITAAESHKEKDIVGTKIADKIIGGRRNNSIFGEKGGDVISGMDGNDTLNGGAGHDVIDGGKGNDVLIGGKGNDEIRSGPGRDLLVGGAGRDMFVCGKGINTIEDFNRYKDSVMIEISSEDKIRRVTDKGGNLSLKYPGGELIVKDTGSHEFFDSLLTFENQGTIN